MEVLPRPALPDGPPLPAASLSLDKLIAFDQMCQRAAGRAEGTISLTTTALRRLESYLLGSHSPPTAAAVTPDVLRAFILNLREVPAYEHHPYAPKQPRPISDQCVFSYLRAIRAAFNRWVAEGLLEVSPFVRVPLPKPVAKVIKPFSDEQVRALLAAVDPASPSGARDLALLASYADTGCRLSEITSLTMDKLDLEHRRMVVLGKGGREREIVFGARLQKLLWKYIHLHRPEPTLPEDDFVFVTDEGRSLTKGRVEYIVKKYGRKASISGVRVSPHTLRHTFCRNWVKNGGDLISLQGMTGHRSLTVLRSYVNLDADDLALAHRRYGLLDRLPALPARPTSTSNGKEKIS